MKRTNRIMALNCVIKFLFAIFGDTVDLPLRVLHYCRHLIRGEPGGLMFIRVSTPKLVIVAKFGLQRLPGFPLESLREQLTVGIFRPLNCLIEVLVSVCVKVVPGVEVLPHRVRRSPPVFDRMRESAFADLRLKGSRRTPSHSRGA
ncbi:hypothetical protein [Mycobacterium riyadhense]|uniref:hypothetical protein n=1 Tax=Mycobacterium riyadhense TaxID=486698 RepID=UPI00111C0BD6|nr:hypothetical protein [Mycobacterium riyadhense]MCV7148307.1 hypothetical protein [Mycobacterium riyadhense]